jgi:hypothetical protein
MLLGKVKAEAYRSRRLILVLTAFKEGDARSSVRRA